jgi:hypothetical protein
VPTNLTQLVGEATLNFREIMASRDIHLIRRLDDGVVVRSAKGMLETVLQNILENAISFSPRGGTITVTLTQDHDTVELQVDDEGPASRRQDRAHLRALLLLAPNQPSEPGRRRIPASASGSCGATSRRWAASCAPPTAAAAASRSRSCCRVVRIDSVVPRLDGPQRGVSPGRLRDIHDLCVG